jgi:hypothetical protein
MKQFLLPAAFVLSILLYSCTGSMNTFAEYSKSVDLKKYRTYAWIPPIGDTVLSNDAMEKMYGKLVKSYSDEELKKKGMVLDIQKPDAVFRYKMGIKSEMAYKQSPTLSIGVAYGGPGYYAGVAVPVAGGNITAKRADEAYLIIEMFEASTGYILWTGGARKTIDNNADSQKNMKLAIHSILSGLPIRHKTK